MEAALFNFNGQEVDLSVEELIDCSPNPIPCQFNSPHAAFITMTEMQYLTGLCSSQDYPYTGEQDTCARKSCDQVPYSQPLGVCCNYPASNDLENSVSQQPTSVMISITADYRFYSGEGILYTSNGCGVSDNPTHGVLAVGYGKGLNGDSSEYWIIKDSLGIGWGDKGFAYIYRSPPSGYSSGVCSIRSFTFFPRIGDNK